MFRRFLKKQILGKPKFIPLRYRFIFMISFMLILVLGTLAFTLGFLQDYTIRNQLEIRGLAIANSLAATSMANLITYNYVALDRAANQASQNHDIIYVIIHDKEGKVAGFSGRPELQNKYLDDRVSKIALEKNESFTQKIFLESGKVAGLDIAVPVFPGDSKTRWGTIRVCLSLVQMYKQIHQTQLIILLVGLIALASGTLLSIFAAKRITSPLNNLVNSTREAARGNLNSDIKISTGDEVEVLASNFSIMIHEILAHRKQLENRLIEIKRLQRYTDQLLMTMGDGLISVDMNGNLSTINPAARKMLKIRDYGIGINIHISELFKNHPKLADYFQSLLNEPIDIKPGEISLNHEGEPQYMLVGSSILKNRAGALHEIIVNLHDITELKKLETSMRQSERLAALGTVAAGMAHEIRNPLSTIKTFVQLLPRKMDKPGFFDKFQNTVPRELNQINQLVEELLELVRIPKYQFESTDIRFLVDQSIDLMEEEFKACRIQYEYKRPDECPHIQADGNQLSKAFGNLIRNAVQAMPEGGKLSVIIHLGDDFLDNVHAGNYKTENLNILIKDTGIGISSKDLKNIFIPFFTTKDKGTGLGLAITHKVISEHGGHIEVKSEEGKGTSFTINLPI